MKRLFWPLAVVLLSGLVGCGGTAESGGSTGQDQVQVTNNAMTPGESRSLASSFALALSCDASSLTWSIQESTLSGFQSPRDGAISSGGQFTAPQCGSQFIGTIMHVVATGCGKSGTANIAVASELLNTVNEAYAVKNPGTASACLAPDPLNVSVPIGGIVQFYAKLTYSCSTVYSPALPTTSWPPPACTQ
jgi:hypothetical protein